MEEESEEEIELNGDLDLEEDRDDDSEEDDDVEVDDREDDLVEESEEEELDDEEVLCLRLERLPTGKIGRRRTIFRF